MMKNMGRILGGLACGAAVAFSLAAAEEPAAGAGKPMAEIQGVVEELVQVAEALPGEAKSVERRKKMREIITPHFDFREMATRSLGDKWNKITVAEQDEFVALFSELLAKTYLNRIENIERGMVKFDSERTASSGALVRTTVKYKDDVFPLDYKLLFKDNSWRVYDVVIENIGLVQNYRNEFAGIIRKEGFPVLLNKLKEKLAG
jgi:phospholipid transport system substrate-binding protein